MPKTWIPRFAVTAVVASAVAFALGGVAAVTAPDGDADARPEARLLTVPTMKVRLLPGYKVRRSFTGRIEARRESRVGFELAGLVKRMLAEEGDHLEAGQVIARLDTARLRVQLKQLAGRRAELGANIALARSTRIRQQQLAKKGHSSRQRYDEARFDEKALHARLRQTDAAIAAVKLDIEKSEIKAPFAAIVGERFADEGIVIAAGVPVFTLLERSNPEVRVGVAGPAVDNIAAGQQFRLLVRGRRVPATVRTILPLRDRGTRSVDVLLALHAPLNGIRHGDLARLELAQQLDRPGFWLPLTALAESSRGLWAVYVATGPSGGKYVLERRELVLLYQEADRVFVRGTLGDDETIVVGGLHRLVPGQKVRITGSEDLLARIRGEQGQ